ncbi:MAG: OsmC family protein [Kofleriaceae bacterium]
MYTVTGETSPGGEAALSARTSRIVFDGSAQSGDILPGPADLLCAALSECILKNVERFSKLLPFHYIAASIRVEAEREEPPPRIVRMRYVLRVVTDESPHRVELLHTNILKFGTITNTLKAACDIHGEIVAEPPP